jgi:putative Ca2+/H+ antiporter (TMEM165/GDT1 family)
VFGAFEGMYFSIFLSESGYRSSYVLAGAVVAAMLVLLLAAVAGYGVMRTRLPDRYRMLLSRGAASVLLIAGSVWFFVRLRG